MTDIEKIIAEETKKEMLKVVDKMQNYVKEKQYASK